MFGINVDPSQRPKPAPKSEGTAVVPHKPELRGMLMRMLKLRLMGAAALVFVAATTWRVAVVRKRKRTYLDFYKTYDARADFERMKRVGVFQSVKKDGSVGGL